MTSLSDRCHLDPCRFCQGSHLRADLYRAAQLLGPGKRGYICQACATRRGLTK